MQILNWSKEKPEKEGNYLVKFIFDDGEKCYDILSILFSDESSPYFSSGHFYKSLDEYTLHFEDIPDSIEYACLDGENG